MSPIAAIHDRSHPLCSPRVVSVIPISAVLFVVGQVLVFPEVLHKARQEREPA